MQATEILAQLNTPERTVIRHVRKGTTYAVTGKRKVKFNGEWHTVVDFISLEDKEPYSRLPEDFEGFEYIYNKKNKYYFLHLFPQLIFGLVARELLCLAGSLIFM